MKKIIVALVALFCIVSVSMAQAVNLSSMAGAQPTPTPPLPACNIGGLIDGSNPRVYNAAIIPVTHFITVGLVGCTPPTNPVGITVNGVQQNVSFPLVVTGDITGLWILRVSDARATGVDFTIIVQ